MNILPQEVQNEINQLVEKLKRFGLKQKKIEALMKQHDHQYLMANISIVETQAKKGNIQNLIAYVLKAIENDYRPVQNQRGLSMVKSEDAMRKQELAVKDQEKQARQEEFEQWKRDILYERLGKYKDSDLAEIKKEFLSTISDNQLFSKMLETKGFDNPVVQIQWFRFLEGVLLNEFERKIDNFNIT